LRALTFVLHLIQPAARLSGRVRHGLTPWRERGRELLSIVPRARRVTIWNEQWRPPEAWLTALEAALREHRVRVLRGGAFDTWDLEVRSGLLGVARARLVVEEHGQGRQLGRYRVRAVEWSIAPVTVSPRVALQGSKTCPLHLALNLAEGTNEATLFPAWNSGIAGAPVVDVCVRSNSRANTEPRADGNRHSYTDADSRSDGNADEHCDGDKHGDAYEHEHADRDAYGHQYPNAYFHFNPDGDTNPNADGDQHADPRADRNGDANANAGANGNRHARTRRTARARLRRPETHPYRPAWQSRQDVQKSRRPGR